MRLRAWISGKRERPRSRTPVIEAAGPAPRGWHDEIGHAALPRVLLDGAKGALSRSAPARQSLGVLYDLFERIGQQHGLGFDEAMDNAERTYLLHGSVGEAEVSVVVMPAPSAMGEAIFVGLVTQPGAPARCIALDRARQGTMLVGLDANGQRESLGPGPAADADAFMAVMAGR